MYQIFGVLDQSVKREGETGSCLQDVHCLECMKPWSPEDAG